MVLQKRVAKGSRSGTKMHKKSMVLQKWVAKGSRGSLWYRELLMEMRSCGHARNLNKSNHSAAQHSISTPYLPSRVWYRKPLMEVRSWSSCFRAERIRSKLVDFHTNSTRNPTVQSSGTSCARAECSSVYTSVQITRQASQRGTPLCNRQARPAWEQNAVQYTFQCKLHDKIFNAESHCAIVRHVLRGSRMQFSIHFSANYTTRFSTRNPIVQSSGTSCVGAECSSVYISVQITRQASQRGTPLCNRQARPAWEQNAV